MRPTLTILLLAVILNACGPLQKMQKVHSQVPIIGSIGHKHTSLFKKSFQKVGEPELDRYINVSIDAFHFSDNEKDRYQSYREKMGMLPLSDTKDSTQIAKLKFYQITISDAVHLVEALNKEKNENLKSYLKEDTELVLLSSISFVAKTKELAKKLDATEELYLTTDSSGSLALVLGGRGDDFIIQKSAIEIFDYNTVPFCWKKDKKGKLQIAQILFDGNKCPGSTETNPQKLNKLPDYLKL